MRAAIYLAAIATLRAIELTRADRVAALAFNTVMRALEKRAENERLAHLEREVEDLKARILYEPEIKA